VTGVDGILKDFIKNISKKLVWIHFHNIWIKHNTQQIYETFLRLNKQWTPIEHKIVKIQIGSNPSHTITRS
jgi:hypothetical protein